MCYLRLVEYLKWTIAIEYKLYIFSHYTATIIGKPTQLWKQKHIYKLAASDKDIICILLWNLVLYEH